MGFLLAVAGIVRSVRGKWLPHGSVFAVASTSPWCPPVVGLTSEAGAAVLGGIGGGGRSDVSSESSTIEN